MAQNKTEKKTEIKKKGTSKKITKIKPKDDIGGGTPDDRNPPPTTKGK